MSNYLDILNRAIELKNKINAIKKDQLEPLEEAFDMLRVQVENEMRKNGVTEISSDFGIAKFVNKVTPGKFNEERLKIALQVDNLSEYRGPERHSSYVLVTPNK